MFCPVDGECQPKLAIGHPNLSRAECEVNIKRYKLELALAKDTRVKGFSCIVYTPKPDA